MGCNGLKEWKTKHKSQICMKNSSFEDKFLKFLSESSQIFLCSVQEICLKPSTINTCQLRQ